MVASPPTPTAAFAASPPPPPPAIDDPSDSDRPHSIAVFGCTGDAGRAVSYHVLKAAAIAARARPAAGRSRRPEDRPDVRSVALAGRDRNRVASALRSIQDELRDREGIDADSVKTAAVAADVADRESMRELARSTRVLVSCVGPYGTYDEAAVRACVEAGTHYVDITGEVDFVERMIADYGEEAAKAGVTLCPFAGYDCVPAELGMFLVGKALEEAAAERREGASAELADLALNFRLKGGGFPRGTVQTILNGIEGVGPKRKEGDPRFYPRKFRGTAKEALSLSNWLLPAYQLGQFAAPNFMSVVNVPVLCRAAPSLGFHELRSISDKSVVGGRPSLLNGYGLVGTQAYIFALALGGAALAFPPFRWLLRSRMKTYRYGGDPNGRFHLDARGRSSEGGTATAFAECVYPGDPAIYGTGLLAAGVAHALHEATASGTESAPLPGFHSPVVALHGCREGLLVEHLRELGADLRVWVVPEEGGGGDAAKTFEVDAAKLRSKL